MGHIFILQRRDKEIISVIERQKIDTYIYPSIKSNKVTKINLK